MPVNLIVIQDSPIELKSSIFEERKKSIDFNINTPGQVAQGPAVLSFNMSVINSTSVVNITVKLNALELQRYSLKNQPTSAVHEAFTITTNPSDNSTIDFEIVDTPLTEPGVVRISDVVIWATTTNDGSAGGGTGGTGGTGPTG
jgi:hypothetical protein